MEVLLSYEIMLSFYPQHCCWLPVSLRRNVCPKAFTHSLPVYSSSKPLPLLILLCIRCSSTWKIPPPGTIWFLIYLFSFYTNVIPVYWDNFLNSPHSSPYITHCIFYKFISCIVISFLHSNIRIRRAGAFVLSQMYP